MKTVCVGTYCDPGEKNCLFNRYLWQLMFTHSLLPFNTYTVYTDIIFPYISKSGLYIRAGLSLLDPAGLYKLLTAKPQPALWLDHTLVCWGYCLCLLWPM